MSSSFVFITKRPPLAMGSPIGVPAITRNLSEGRYVHNILVSSGSTVYTIASGNVLVNAGIASAP